MGKYQESKKVALSYFDALEKAEPEQVIQVFREYMNCTPGEYRQKTEHK